MFLGFGGVVTFKNAESVRKVLEEAEPDRILLETDAPYLAPVPYRGKRNEPSYVPLIAEKCAEVTGRSTRELEAVTAENALTLFTRIAR
jgi:TatD DNase family protein